jgi:hypothetical protein
MRYTPPANISAALKRLLEATEGNAYRTEQISVRLSLINPITQTYYQSKKIINPITKRELKNTYATRVRINKAITQENEKRTKSNNEFASKYNSQFTQIKDSQEFSFASKILYENDKVTDLDGLYTWVNKIRAQRVNNPIMFKAVTLYFNTQNDLPIWRTLNISDFNSRDAFDYAISKLKDDGLNNGSDVVSGFSADTDIIPSKIDIWGVRQSGANGNSTKSLFEILQVNGSKKSAKGCINKSLKHIGFDTKYKMDALEQLVAHIKKNKLPIRIISNTITDIQTPNNIKYTNCTAKNGKRIAVAPINNCQYRVNSIYEPEVYLHTLIYVEADKHIDVIPDNQPVISDNVYITEYMDVYKLINGVYTPVYTTKQLYKASTVAKDIMTVKYVFFDYEAVVEWKCSSIFKPYSLSWFVYSHEELDSMLADNKLIKSVFDDKTRRNNVIGYDCGAKFAKWILENQHNTIFKFVGFNSANYDNYMLMSDLFGYKLKSKSENMSITDVQYNGNQLLNFKINGRHTMYDIRKHLVGSLDYNCKAFKVPAEYSKVEGFSHTDMQLLFDGDNDKFISEISAMTELVEYNDRDVLATGYLFMKYYESTTNIDKEGYDFLGGEKFTNTATIGSIIWKRAQKHWKQKGIELPKLSLKQYDDILRSKAAGRVDLFKATMGKIVDEIVSLDVCSLYPYIMSIFPGYFPCGEITETNDYIKPPTQEDGSGLIGFWYCTVDQRALHANNLPNILPKKIMSSSGACLENDWNSQDILEDQFISNITIELLKSYEHIGVTVEVKSGIVFSDKVKSCEMFGFLGDLMKLKNEQDKLSKNNDPKYNPALRECSKLQMNAVSGKVIEGLHLEQVKLVSTQLEMDKINAKYEVSAINNIGSAVFVSYNKSADEELHKQRPVYIGAMIYEFSRCYMYKNIMAPIGLDKLLYMDTDACKFRASDVAAWQATNGNKIVPHWPEVEAIDSRYIEHKVYDPNSKVFGSLEDELKQNNVSYFLQKKSWLTANVVDGKPVYIKCRFKGISTNSHLLTGNEPFLAMKGDKPVIVADAKTVFDWCNANEDSKIGGDYDKKKGVGFIGKQLEFYEQIYTNKFAYVLCSNFRKSVKNSKTAAVGDTAKYNKNNNTISLQYVVKKITIN